MATLVDITNVSDGNLLAYLTSGTLYFTNENIRIIEAREDRITERYFTRGLVKIGG